MCLILLFINFLFWKFSSVCPETFSHYFSITGANFWWNTFRIYICGVLDRLFDKFLTQKYIIFPGFWKSLSKFFFPFKFTVIVKFSAICIVHCLMLNFILLYEKIKIMNRKSKVGIWCQIDPRLLGSQFQKVTAKIPWVINYSFTGAYFVSLTPKLRQYMFSYGIVSTLADN